MKPTGQIDFVSDTDLLVCLGDDRGDGELQVSFEESLSLQLAAGFQCLLLLASQIQKEHSIEDLLNFFNSVSDTSIIETQLFKAA